MILIDLNDVAYLPYNSAARQLVYTEAGRGVESVIVDGRVVIKERKVKTIDEDALRREVADLMRHFIADYDAVVESRKRALPYMLDAHRRVWQADIGMNRFIGGNTLRADPRHRFDLSAAALLIDQMVN